MAKQNKNNTMGVQNPTIAVRGDLAEEREMWFQYALIIAASQLSQPLIAGKTPEEAVDIYARVHQQLESWYKAAPAKAQLLQLVDSFLPETPY